MKNRKSAVRVLSLILALVSLVTLVSCKHDHEMGEWSHDEANHTRVCTVKKCDYSETEAHSFDAGTVKSEPTVEKNGETVYTCTVCGFTRSEETQVVPGITLETFETWDIHTELQRKALNDKLKMVIKYARGVEELSYPETCTFSWSIYNVKPGSEPSQYTFMYGEKADLSDAVEYTCSGNEFSIENGGMNLKVRTTYYWQVKGILADGRKVESEIASFTTLDGPRNLYIDGVANVRDIGGKDCDGGVLKQGLMYRCGRLHENYSYTQKITQKGIDTMLGLGIKSEIDLRGKIKDGINENGDRVNGSFTVTKSMLGDSVKYYHCGAEYSDTMLTTAVGRKMVKETFEVLADESNYPLIFHCSIGTDRTGIIAILTEGVCGVELETVERDYLFSNFGNIGSARDYIRFNTVITAIQSQKGDSFMEKCRNYLLSCGVTEAQIESVRDILIDRTVQNTSAIYG